MNRRAHTRFRAFTLVEVTLSLGVISFCLVALFGLLPIGLKSNQDAVEQTAANGILSTVIADLRATPTFSGTTQQLKISIPTDPTQTGSGTLFFTVDGRGTDANGNPVTSLTTDSRYRLAYSFVSNGAPSVSGTSHAASLVNLQVSWPAAVDPSKSQPNGKVVTFVALDRN